jgi:hypothetical protein
VLVTGTHEGTAQVVNTLYGSHGVIRSDRWERLPGSYHGSGCTLASAVAAYLAQRRSTSATRCTAPRNTPGAPWPQATGRAWDNSFRIGYSGRGKETDRCRQGLKAGPKLGNGGT